MTFFSKTDNRILWAVKILLGLCLLTPLLMSSSFIFPYTVPKTFAFRILVELAAVFYLYLCLKSPQFSFIKGLKSLQPPFVALRAITRRVIKGGRGGILNLAVLVFLAVYFLSAIFGVDFYASWWGDLERGIGFWGLAHFVLFFLMLGAVLKIENSPSFVSRNLPPLKKGGGEGGGIFSLRLLQISVFVSGLISLLAIIQKFTSLGLLIPQADRVSSTIGNAGFLGTYLLFNIFFTGYLALSSLRGERSGVDNDNIISPSPQMRGGLGWGDEIKINTSPKSPPQLRRGGKNWNSLIPDKMLFTVYCLLLIVDCLALFFTGTRGAMLGLAAGVIVFLALLALTPLFKGGKGGFKEFKKWPIVILAAIFLLSTALFLARDTAFVKNNSTLFRLTSISLSDTTAQNRLILWQRSWQAWQERPILGWGPENYGVAANKYFDRRLAPYEAWYDRAHNFIFDYGVVMGWLGLLGYLGIIFTAFTRLFILLTKKLVQNADFSILYSIEKSARKERETVFYFSVIFGALLAAYLVQNFFVFDTFVSYLMLFFVLALIPSFKKEPVPHLMREGLGRIYSADSNPSQPPFTKGGEKQNPPLFKGGRGGIYFPLYKKVIFSFIAICLLFIAYSFNLKPLLASRLGNEILSWQPPESTEKLNSALKDALVLNTFASDEIVYQVTLDYLAKANNFPQLTQNENFYTVAAGELQKIIERSPLQLRNYIALAWLNLYFSDRHRERIESAVALAQKAKELAPVRKDAYLILTAAYSISDEPQKAQEIVKRAEAIDAGLGKEVKEYWEKLKQ